MNPNYYHIAVLTVVALVFLPSLILYLQNTGFLQYVKAGKVDDFCLRYAFVLNAHKKQLRVKGILHDVSSLLMFVVHGNSMCQYGVKSGQRIFVQKLNDNTSKDTIQTHPMLMLSIIDASKWQSQYKLRKFINYIEKNTDDWGAVYDANRNFIESMSRDAFIETMLKKACKVHLNEERHILSVTFNEHSNALEYSLHPVSSLYGIVRFAA